MNNAPFDCNYALINKHSNAISFHKEYPSYYPRNSIVIEDISVLIAQFEKVYHTLNYKTIGIKIKEPSPRQLFYQTKHPFKVFLLLTIN